MIEQKTFHQPVLLSEVMEQLQPKAGETYLDLTAGYGGHARPIIEQTANAGGLVLVDRDPQAITYLKQKFAKEGVKLIHSDFLTASRELAEQGKKFDIVLADLGVSSPHLNETKRGFSFGSSGPLDMRMDSSQELTASDIVNKWSEAELARILRQYGEDPKAQQIARRIVQNRPIVTTGQLAAITKQAWPGHSRVHPATRTFQALRIAVNDELNQLKSSLPIWLELLAQNGRLAIISFHSLEDRIVKNFLAEHSMETYDAQLKLLTKKPITASPNEIVSNPRARSAKLRAAVKIKKY